MKLALALQTPEVPGLLSISLLQGSLEEKLRKASTLGYEGVELITTNPSELLVKEMRTNLQANGLEVAAISSGAMFATLGITLLHSDPGVMQQARDRLSALIDFAAALSAPLVTIGSFRGRAASVAADGRAVLMDILSKAASVAESRSVRLALEALNRYEGDLLNNADEALEFVREIGHPSLGILLDTFHVNIEESSWTQPFQRALAQGKLFHVHLGDNNRLPPGKGLIDFAAILNTLRENGYSAYLSAELLAKPDPDTAARDTSIYMRKIMETS